MWRRRPGRRVRYRYPLRRRLTVALTRALRLRTVRTHVRDDEDRW